MIDNVTAATMAEAILDAWAASTRTEVQVMAEILDPDVLAALAVEAAEALTK